MDFIAPLLIMIGVLGGAWYFFSQGEEKGSANAKLDQANEALDDISKANAVVDHWNSDPAFRDRVSSRYTKK